jgi:hypothetical protein
MRVDNLGLGYIRIGEKERTRVDKLGLGYIRIGSNR